MQDTPLGEVLEQRKNPQKEFQSTLRFLVTLLAVFFVITYLFSEILIGVQVVGSSMEPTLYEGDYLFVNTTSKIEYGDIIVVEANQKDSIHDDDAMRWLIKRVIGLPGDTIWVNGNKVYRKHAGEIEFTELNEPYLDPNDSWGNYNLAPVEVGEGEVYVLGDHRSVSSDSRRADFGTLLLDNVMGVVTDWSLKYKDAITSFFGFFSRSENK